MTYRTPPSTRRDFLQLLLCEDLDTLSTDLGVSAQTLSRMRGIEIERVKSVLGSLPGEDQILDREVFERRRRAG